MRLLAWVAILSALPWLGCGSSAHPPKADATALAPGPPAPPERPVLGLHLFATPALRPLVERATRAITARDAAQADPALDALLAAAEAAKDWDLLLRLARQLLFAGEEERWVFPVQVRVKGQARCLAEPRRVLGRSKGDALATGWLTKAIDAAERAGADASEVATLRALNGDSNYVSPPPTRRLARILATDRWERRQPAVAKTLLASARPGARVEREQLGAELAFMTVMADAARKGAPLGVVEAHLGGFVDYAPGEDKPDGFEVLFVPTHDPTYEPVSALEVGSLILAMPRLVPGTTQRWDDVIPHGRYRLAMRMTKRFSYRVPRCENLFFTVGSASAVTLPVMVERVPDIPPARQAAVVQKARGEARKLVAAGEPGHAVMLLQQTLTSLPEDPDLLLDLADAELANGFPQNARPVAVKALGKVTDKERRVRALRVLVEARDRSDLASADADYRDELARLGAAIVPVTVSRLGEVVQLVGGQKHVCARQKGGSVYCFGEYYLQPVANWRSYSAWRMTNVTDAVDTDSGDSNSCAVGKDGLVLCWGRADTGLRGKLGVESGMRATPIAGLGPAVQVATGNERACARLRTGKVQCWGGVLYSDIARVKKENAGLTIASPLAFIENAVDLAAAGPGFCAAQRTAQPGQASIICWNASQPAPPAPIEEKIVFEGFRRLVRGPGPCAVVETAGQERIACHAWTQKPWEALVESPLSQQSGIAALASHGGRCRVLGDGAVECWGSFGYDLPDGQDAKAPYRIKDLPPAQEVTVVDEGACALLQDKTVSCWGRRMRDHLTEGGQRTTGNAPARVVVKNN